MTILACWLGATQPAIAQVQKCVDRQGKTLFSNVGCPNGTSRRDVDVRPNVVDMSGLREQADILEAEKASRRAVDVQSYGAHQQPTAPRSASSCPSELDIRNMEVSISSPSLSKKERAFHEAEVRRARQCRAGEGKYADSDWKASKEALDDQRSVSEEVRRRGRARAESVHSAANPEEAKRIAFQREQEEARREARHQAALAAGAAAAAAAKAAARSLTISGCQADGCYTFGGGFYAKKNGDSYAGPKGFCRRHGDQLHCP